MTPGTLRNSLIALVACGALALFSASVLQQPAGIPLRACFDNVGGLERGDPVMIGGVAVGRVASVALDADYRACAALEVDPKLVLADDTSAAIHTRNVLGDRYVALEVGSSEQSLGAGDEIAYTKSALVAERLIGRLLLSFGGQ